MALRRYRKHVFGPSTITVAGDTGALDVLSRVDAPSVSALIVCGTVTGAGASLTPTLECSEDGTTWYTLAAGSAMTATGAKQRLNAANVVEPFVRVSWPLPAGTTPSFAGFQVTLVFN